MADRHLQSPLVAQPDPALSARIVGSTPLPKARAGSALIFAGRRLLIVQDDAFELIWLDPTTLAEERVPLVGSGERLPKAEKPDFEAALLTGGAIYVLGSGSAANRRWITRIDIERRTTDLRSAGPLYEAVARALETEPNIEGAVVIDETLRLFHRGSGRPPAANPSAMIDLPRGALDGGDPRVLSITRCDLGSIDGVPLAFTDAATKDDGRSALYLAVAEDAPDAIADGPIVGAAIGLMNETCARYARLLESDGSPCVRKPEGVALDTGDRSGFLITDPDSPSEPAELCRFILEGDW